jgi:hypothetical protein
MTNTGFMRPHNNDIAFIYDALVNESKNRDKHDFFVWVENERLAVLNAANEVAQNLGKDPITMEHVIAAEQSAEGHFDYMKKFSTRVYEMLHA